MMKHDQIKTLIIVWVPVFIGSHQDVHQTAVADTTHQIICQSHEDCDARSCEIKPIKGFQAKEQVKGHTVSSLKFGLRGHICIWLLII